MPFEFKLPSLGENVESGEVTSVLVKEGDTVEEGQYVLEIEAAKAVEPLPAPKAGKVSKIHVQVGDEVPIGAKLLTLETEAAAESGEESPSEDEPEEKKATQQKPTGSHDRKKRTKARSGKEDKKAEKEKDEDGETESDSDVDVEDEESSADDNNGASKFAEKEDDARRGTSDVPIAAGPSTRRLARELGIDLATVEGSGNRGRITREDIVAAVRELSQGTKSAATAPKENKKSQKPDIKTAAGKTESDEWGNVRREPLPGIRKTIAKLMVHSASTIPHVTNFDDADITELDRIRKGGMADYAESSVKLTMMPFVMKAVAHALKHHAMLNASIDMESQQVLYKEYVNLGVAVDTERGLLVPVMRNVDRLNIPEIAAQLSELVEKVRGGKFSSADGKGGTFTISNLGAIGGTYSTPIINHPEVAILLIGRSRKLPIVIDDQTQIRLMMPLSLSYDHRLVDGATAGRFLNEVIDYLETPGRLFLAP